jgi:hypothetical protein
MPDYCSLSGGAKPTPGYSARDRNNPHNNLNDNNGFRVAVSTLLHEAVSQPEMSGGERWLLRLSPLPGRGERNGGVLSWPRPKHEQGAGQITTGRVSSVRP